LSTIRERRSSVLLEKTHCVSLRNYRAFPITQIKAIITYVVRLLINKRSKTQVCRSCRRFAISTVDIHLCGKNYRRCSTNVYTSTKDTITATT